MWIEVVNRMSLSPISYSFPIEKKKKTKLKKNVSSLQQKKFLVYSAVDQPVIFFQTLLGSP